MKTTLLLASIIVAVASVAFAQEQKDASPEKAAIAAADRAYEEAYAKGDVKALASFFSDDAVFTADDGRTVIGRAAIEESLRKSFAGNKGSKLAITVNSVRTIAPEVVVEKGSTAVTAKDGEVSSALYTAIHVKKDGKWKITELVESPLPAVTAHEHLTELAWLIGNWEEADKNADLTVRSQYSWANGGNFITRNVTVKREGATVIEGWQVIGWDPIDARIRSWTFDDEGGYAEGRWTREGDRWLLQEQAVAQNGDRTTAENTIARVGADRLTWESNNRTLNGEPQPSISRVEIVRVKGK
jgi:uncharacterized protein (TIGR02246 family)